MGRETDRRRRFPRWGAWALPVGALWGPVIGLFAGALLGNAAIGGAIGAGLGIGVGLALLAAGFVIASDDL
ncbi:MAG TPA: hypothetical protein VF322_02770 [Gammaproteobacteria bacterium]